MTKNFAKGGREKLQRVSEWESRQISKEDERDG